jgi:hypothetical protein
MCDIARARDHARARILHYDYDQGHELTLRRVV